MRSDAEGRGPFDRLRPVALLAAGYGLATIVWVSAGGALPGGRWLAVHLFTLGVVTNLVLGLTDHFSRALMHQPGAMPWWQLALTNAGVLAVLWGIPSGERWSVAAGATVLSVVVFASYRRLRTLRRTSLGPRFAWVVRMYERAHGAFLHGALLGALIGTGVFAGRWIFAARTAHLHVNLLGWAGLTLLATVVFFGPTIGRTRIREGADARAARALRSGATALTSAVLALLGTGFSGTPGTVCRLVAAVGLAVYAWSVVVVCAPVVRALLAARAPGRWPVLATVVWFPLVAWADVGIVATGTWRLLEPLGAAMLLGVLAQAIAASLGYLAPQLRPLGPARDKVRERGEAWILVRALAWNAGMTLVVAAAAVGPAAGGVWAAVAETGWTLVLAAALSQAIIVASAFRAVRRTGRRDRAHRP
jgi:nitrite reductase (NO-forming)